PETVSEACLQAALEHYLRALRERIPAVIELEGALPADFWTQAESTLANYLASVESHEPQSDEWAHQMMALTTPRVDELLAMESSDEISLDMLRYELRIGPLSDSRAERFALHQGKIKAKMAAF